MTNIKPGDDCNVLLGWAYNLVEKMLPDFYLKLISDMALLARQPQIEMPLV